MKLEARTMGLSGTSYEVGVQLGRMTAAVPPLLAHHTGGMEGFGADRVKEAVAVFDRWCPGLSDELRGFADALEVPLARVVFFGMTCLTPRCSHIALSPALTRYGRPLVARNYEFSHEAEDFCLVKTSVEGKYTHMGTSVLHFGRDDGFNEHGLAVTMSSCGFPVGPLPNMRPPGVAGLQFWAVVRAVLENCRAVQEAVDYVKDMPIAFNINLMVTDKAGDAALVETMDGRMAVKRLDDSGTGYLHATNHPVLPEIIAHEPRAMKHSAIRYDWIKDRLAGAAGVTAEDLKAMLLSRFPAGLACHYFEDFFGTTKSMVIDPACGTIDLCWGGSPENGWRQYAISEPLGNTAQEIKIGLERFDPGMAEYLPLEAEEGR